MTGASRVDVVATQVVVPCTNLDGGRPPIVPPSGRQTVRTTRTDHAPPRRHRGELPARNLQWREVAAPG